MAKSALLSSSLAKKYWMAFSGLFLCLFLLGHLAGNLQLFMTGLEGKTQFNEYAYFMTHNPAVVILSYITYASILFHAIDGLVLTLRNRKARPVKYAYEKASASSAWSSRNMGILGTIILAFIVGHMYNFWFKMKFPFDEMPTQAIKGYDAPVKDLYQVVMDFFNVNVNSLALLAVLLYVIAQIAIAFHLWHGFQSAWQSVGIRHPKYTKLLKGLGVLMSIVVPALFAIIPIYLYVSQMG